VVEGEKGKKSFLQKTKKKKKVVGGLSTRDRPVAYMARNKKHRWSKEKGGKLNLIRSWNGNVACHLQKKRKIGPMAKREKEEGILSYCEGGRKKMSGPFTKGGRIPCSPAQEEERGRGKASRRLQGMFSGRVARNN